MSAVKRPVEVFQPTLVALPLFSLDWAITNPAGELVLGKRVNAPAIGWWFTPGGRIRKNEALERALQRIDCHGLGLAREVFLALLGAGTTSLPTARSTARWLSTI